MAHVEYCFEGGLLGARGSKIGKLECRGYLDYFETLGRGGQTVVFAQIIHPTMEYFAFPETLEVQDHLELLTIIISFFPQKPPKNFRSSTSLLP